MKLMGILLGILLMLTNSATQAAFFSLSDSYQRHNTPQQKISSEQATIEFDAESDTSERNFPLWLEVTEKATGQKLKLKAGQYTLRAGDYQVQYFRANPATNEPYQQYQIVEEQLSLAPFDSIKRFYP